MSAPQCLTARHPLPFKKRLAFADETQSQMGKRSEITARANRAFFRNHWIDAPVQHFAKQLDDFATNSTEAERQNIRTQHDHRAHLGLRQRISNSTGVAADKVQLKLTQFALRNSDVGELAESGGDSVNHRIARNDLFDQFARGKNTRTRERRNVNGLASDSDRCKLDKRNLLPLQLHSGSLVRIVEAEKEKGQVGIRPGLLGEPAHNKLPGIGAISSMAPELGSQPPCVARKPRVPTRYPTRPRPCSCSNISIYTASFRSKLL